jgi:hypothetical protein
MLKRLIQLSLQSIYLCGLGLLLCFFVSGPVDPALAKVSRIETSSGDVILRSQASLPDQEGETWEVLAASWADHRDTKLYFQATSKLDLDPKRPIELITPQGSSYISENLLGQESPVPRYDLQPLITSLDPEVPALLVLPLKDTKERGIILPPKQIREWQSMLDFEETFK